MHGYAEFLEAIADPKHPDHEEMRAWAGTFDPNDFTPAKVKFDDPQEAVEEGVPRRALSAMDETDRPELKVLQNPIMKLMPLALGIIAIAWGLMASLIPGISVVGRIAAFAVIIGTIAYVYFTTIRRLVVGEDAVDIELTRKKVRIPYSNLDYMTVRANHLGGALRLKLVLKAPPAAIRGRIGLCPMRSSRSPHGSFQGPDNPRSERKGP